jgi:hypothetical protein
MVSYSEILIIKKDAATEPGERMSNECLYDRDFCEWTTETARLLREGRWQQADMNRVAEEIDRKE